jgi:hypothetical protein
MVNVDTDRIMGLLDKYCSDGECILKCKIRERKLKTDCVIARFVKYTTCQLGENK